MHGVLEKGRRLANERLVNDEFLGWFSDEDFDCRAGDWFRTVP